MLHGMPFRKLLPSGPPNTFELPPWFFLSPVLYHTHTLLPGYLLDRWRLVLFALPFWIFLLF